MISILGGRFSPRSDKCGNIQFNLSLPADKGRANFLSPSLSSVPAGFVALNGSTYIVKKCRIRINRVEPVNPKKKSLQVSPYVPSSFTSILSFVDYPGNKGNTISKNLNLFIGWTKGALIKQRISFISLVNH